jgi:hypothetical protein
VNRPPTDDKQQQAASNYFAYINLHHYYLHWRRQWAWRLCTQISVWQEINALVSMCNNIWFYPYHEIP